METKEINLNEIHKLPESEFKRHFAQWVEEDGVARALQAKLRKDLIETFNRTHLGRRIYAIYSKANRMILSPLILALNTLVAEFLYAQNCHFTLSVFSTEVPYRNTLPDFESVSTFRFTKSDIKEIFEAISNDITEEFKQDVECSYLIKPTAKYCPSLLYLIFKYIFKKSSTEKRGEVKPHQGESARTDSRNNRSDSESSKRQHSPNDKIPCKKTLKAQYNNQFRYLNKYLIILSRKVKQMSNNLEQLKGRELSSDRQRRKTLQTRKMENLNKSLGKISENLRICSMSKRKNRKMSIIITAIDKLALQMEKCSENFKKMSRKMCQAPTDTKTDKNSTGEDKKYSDWVKELTDTSSGRKFVAKIEVALRKTLEEEKDKLAQAFEQKLVNHKNLLKLRYKHKLLKRLESQNQNENKQIDTSNEIRNHIERKLEELSKKHEELLGKIRQGETQMKESTVAFNVQSQSPKEMPASARRKLFQDAIEEDNEKPFQEDQRNPLRPKSKRLEVRNDLKPKLEEMVQSIAKQERNIDHIIYGAKLRIQELEFESNQLDRSFQDYMEKQSTQKNQLGTNVANIWNNYKTQNTILSNPRIKRRSRFRNKKNVEQSVHFSDGQGTEDARPPPIVQSSEDNTSSDEQCKMPAMPFENPFRTMKDELLGKDAWKVENTLAPAVKHLPQKLDNFIDSSVRFERAERPNIENVEITENRLHPSNIESDRNLTPVSSEYNLKDATLEGIAVSDTKSSERSYSSPNLSLALKVPNIILTRCASMDRDISPTQSESDSISQKLDFSAGKQGSSEGSFWD